MHCRPVLQTSQHTKGVRSWERLVPFPNPTVQVTLVVSQAATILLWEFDTTVTVGSAPWTGYQGSEDGVTWYDPTAATIMGTLHVHFTYGTYGGSGLNFWRVTASAVGLTFAGAFPPYLQTGETD